MVFCGINLLKKSMYVFFLMLFEQVPHLRMITTDRNRHKSHFYKVWYDFFENSSRWTVFQKCSNRCAWKTRQSTQVNSIWVTSRYANARLPHCIRSCKKTSLIFEGLSCFGVKLPVFSFWSFMTFYDQFTDVVFHPETLLTSYQQYRLNSSKTDWR